MSSIAVGQTRCGSSLPLFGLLRKECDMECPKCEGLMIEESLLDGSGCINQWRCVNCGAILDAVIAQNQLRRSTRGRAFEISSRW